MIKVKVETNKVIAEISTKSKRLVRKAHNATYKAGQMTQNMAIIRVFVYNMYMPNIKIGGNMSVYTIYVYKRYIKHSDFAGKMSICVLICI